VLWTVLLMMACSDTAASVLNLRAVGEQLQVDLLAMHVSLNTYWIHSLDPCDWDGIECSIEQGIVAIQLGGTSGRGQLPSSWASTLPNLTSIDLSDNMFSGGVPSEWADFTSLSILRLNGNRLNGTLPVSWRLLSGLQVLDLSHNVLHGSLPEGWSGMTVSNAVLPFEYLSHSA
jgi:hypothetical protein